MKRMVNQKFSLTVLLVFLLLFTACSSCAGICRTGILRSRVRGIRITSRRIMISLTSSFRRRRWTGYGGLMSREGMSIGEMKIDMEAGCSEIG